MMNEQEHWDHEAGAASELQNCYAEASSRYHLEVSRHGRFIRAALERGEFVVVESRQYHCKATDAVVGMVKYLVSSHPTRDAANAAALAYYNAGDEDCNIDVLPALPAAPQPVTPDSGLPF